MAARSLSRVVFGGLTTRCATSLNPLAVSFNVSLMLSNRSKSSSTVLASGDFSLIEMPALGTQNSPPRGVEHHKGIDCAVQYLAIADQRPFHEARATLPLQPLCGVPGVPRGEGLAERLQLP
ncbi:hypothetical protein [Infirmifilum sp. SLHALR2]